MSLKCKGYNQEECVYLYEGFMGATFAGTFMP